jgi:hypothetical protein
MLWIWALGIRTGSLNWPGFRRSRPTEKVRNTSGF